MESLNSLDFRWGADGCFYNCPAEYLSWHLEATVTCDTHITLLESDRDISSHSLLSDFMCLWALVSHDWPFISCHVL